MNSWIAFSPMMFDCCFQTFVLVSGLSSIFILRRSNMFVPFMLPFNSLPRPPGVLRGRSKWSKLMMLVGYLDKDIFIAQGVFVSQLESGWILIWIWPVDMFERGGEGWGVRARDDVIWNPTSDFVYILIKLCGSILLILGGCRICVWLKLVLSR